MEARQIETTIYVAKDGKTFEKEEDCQKYEKKMELGAFIDEAKKRLDEIRIDSPVFFPLDIYFSHNRDTRDCKRILKNTRSLEYFELQSEDDLDKLACILNYEDKYTGDITEKIKQTAKIKEYPQIVCCGHLLNFGREIHTVETQVALIKDYFRKMGYKATVTLEKTT